MSSPNHIRTYFTYVVLLCLALGFLSCISAHNTTSHRRLAPRDSFTTFSNPDNNEGEDHKNLEAPNGARIKDFPIGDGGEQIPVFWSDPLTDQKAEATHAFIVIHGRLRDGANYWTIMNDALQSAVDEEYPGADRKSFIVAPQFFSEKYNKGQYSSNELAFADVNAWQAGDTATHPSGTNITSMDALDALIIAFSNKTEYPSLTNITLVGHGGGGQLTARYAAVGADAPEGVHLRYIVGDPSTNAYFTQDRPMRDDSGDPSCEFWDTWRYGYKNFNGTRTGGNKSPFQYFSQYISRDIVLLVALNDTSPDNGDQYCPAQMQGGSARRDRNLAWWTYINTLARTKEPVQMLQQTFNNSPAFVGLPNWSNVTKKTEDGEGVIVGPRLIVVEDASHDAAEVLGGMEGRAALFSSKSEDMPVGWRPSGWNETESDCSMCDESKENLGTETGGDDSGGDGSGNGDGNGELGRSASITMSLVGVVLLAEVMLHSFV
ncbi:hypothetical protein K435DRAFT_767424 [Dendrothele bispora CBS 962.96]|uniref:Alpha/beta-hydrolase n=1 Tax=Dendrothele bispora (strain CBS 962.96) TaxID=1314807 RepID=A0A4S8KZ84_DENBC|nr:hypothetical protein K435DRAFT_767424 [Dendrothele bispora CBS 962.96]